MDLREIRLFVAMLGCAWTLPASVSAAGVADDASAAMRVERVVPPAPAADLVLRAIDGSSIRLADFKGKAVVLGFFAPN